MKKVSFKTIIVLFTCFLLAAGLILFKKQGKAGSHPGEIFETEENEREDENEKNAGINAEMMMFWTSRAYPDPTNINAKYLSAWTRAIEMRNVFATKQIAVDRTGSISSSSSALSYNGNWSSLGPNKTWGGRILSIAVNPVRGNSVYAGTAGGGIWKSDDGASNWHSVSTDYPMVAATSIIINPSDTMQIYAGTGEIYRTDSAGSTTLPDTSNTGFNVWKMRGTYGIGVLKSSDGGSTWTQVLIRSENNLFGVQRLRFDPNTPSTIYACATDGLYRSTNSGNSWTRILAKCYVSDVVINASNTNQIVAAVGNLQNTDKGIYRSADGGSTWTLITSGLPVSFQGFIRFDNLKSAGNQNTIVASIGVAESSSGATCPTNCPTELYRSTDFGVNWTGLSNSGHTNWQYWCAHSLAIDPANANHILYGGVKLYSYTLPSTHVSDFLSHDDLHDIQYDPTNSNNVYVATDMGVYKSTNGSGTSFTQMNNGLGAVQFYSTVGVSTTNANVIIGGLQDNGVVSYNGSTWSQIIGSDGAACAIDSANDNNMLASFDARAVYYSTAGTGSLSNTLSYWGSTHDSRTGFVAPLAISKSNSATVYVGTDELFKSTNHGNTWNATNPGTNYIDALHKTAIALAISSKTANKVYVSTSPFAQFDNDADNLYYSPPANVLKTTTGGTPFTKIIGTAPDTLPNRYIMHFAVSPSYDDSVWVAVGGFGTPHVYVTPDGGSHWYSKDPGGGTGLPDVPANAIMIDPKNPKIIYVGNDFGIYVSTNSGASWADFNNGLWDATLVVDLEPYPGNKILAATHGKGIFVSPLMSTALPITLLSFTGENKGNANQLNWISSDERNFNHFELERSADGAHYKKLTTVLPLTSAGEHSYRYDDYYDQNSGNDLYYYRLKSVDNDGTYTYSNIVVIRLSVETQVKVYGTLSNGKTDIEINSGAPQPAGISLFDASGRLLVQKNISLIRGENKYMLNDPGQLSKGVYLLRVTIKNKVYTNRILRQ